MKALHYGWATFTLSRSNQPSLGSRPWQRQLQPRPPCLAGSPDCSLLLSLPALQSVHLSVCLNLLLCVPVLLRCSLTLDLALPCPPRASPGPPPPAAAGGQPSHWSCRPPHRRSDSPRHLHSLSLGPLQTLRLGAETLQEPGQRLQGPPARPVTPSCQRGLPSSPRPTPGRKSHSRCHAAWGFCIKRSGQGGG